MATIESTTYAAPGEAGSPVELKDRYDNFIGGEWVAPTTGEYRENPTPSTGEPFCKVAHSGPQDIELALDAAHAAKGAWGRRSPTERAAVLNAVADAIDENLEMLAVAESYENGKPVRETLAADIPSRPTTSATSQARFAQRKGGSLRSTRTPTRTTSTSRWGSLARSSRSTSRY